MLDAGEWKSAIGRKKEVDGTDKIVLTTPPWLAWPQFLLKETNGKKSLHLEDGQRKVVFEAVKAAVSSPKTSGVGPALTAEGARGALAARD